MKSSELIKRIKKEGWKEKRTTGSHIILERNGETLSVPFHASKEVPTGLCKKLMKQAGVK